MDNVSLQIIIDRLNHVAERLYNQDIESVDASYLLDSIIDDLTGWLPYVKNTTDNGGKK